MNPARRRPAIGPFGVGLALLAGLPRTLPAQTPASRHGVLAAARAIMEAARFCALVTLDDAGADT
ncbi:MAG: hypothetical protein R6X22_05320 [Gemmatimonadota bacterium]